MTPPRLAVIGLGTMGRNHLRILSDMDSADLVSVCDASPEVAAVVAQKYGVVAYTSWREMLDRETLDAVIVAAPTRHHFEIGLAAVKQQLHVLMEKPIASTVDEARELVAAAAGRCATLTVGHIERFNPAVRELRRHLSQGELGRVFKIHARRCGPFPDRIRDVGVVIDLATHDLDIFVYLLGSEPVRMFAETARRIHTDHEDLLNALLRFPDGTVGVLDVNWLTPTKVRDITVLGERGMFHVDYLAQDLSFYENDITHGMWDRLSSPSGVSEGNMTRFYIARAEPLRLELDAFLRCVVGAASPEVTGQDGERALRLAAELVASGRSCQPHAVEPSLSAAMVAA
jgi:UDP-N-acetylglucosamine 3-dehydrogenase